MTAFEYGTGIWAFGQFVDRYAGDGYGPPRSTEEMLDAAAQVQGLTYLDINVPFATDSLNAHDVKTMLDDRGLKCRATTPHIYMREYSRGAFTNPDSELRLRTRNRVEEAVEAAAVLDAGYVKFWPGQDGYDYPGQVDYEQIWGYTVNAMREICEKHSDVQFAIEYKPKEPRVRMTLANAPKTLLAIQETGVDNLGIVMDFGHSLMAGESPTESLLMINRYEKLVSAELNDNWRDWDDDLPVASVHLFETMEYLLALRSIEWKDPLLLDQFPFRENPVAAVARSIETIEMLSEACTRVDGVELAEAQSRQDALTVQRIYWNALLGSPRFP
ncbi:MAG: TIM barrel protein [Candidatus Nanopelagicales bacterium]|nr:TIM barrel protein [Candidatus Nanopelagicales bacterium]MBL6835388.1 TIM barrel protein [Candidatus Nanopelagicales bacterium]MBM03043.1 xylose isomerase [Micrococcales bacterium]RZP25924.1 MAG: sugar phosphate isomerase/epimerase [Acidimicrobiales bacterium]|tara:strand:- start:352 stop:1341 length:990 start_codon:yes stop_codon:yes gene_type:complete